MSSDQFSELRQKLSTRKAELEERLERITANVRRGYDPDSKERAQELENSEVVDALGNEARRELRLISSALERMSSGDFGICVGCGEEIGAGRLAAHPYALECIDCARDDERRR